MHFVLGYANYIKHDPYILDLRVEREREREGEGKWPLKEKEIEAKV